MQLEKDSYRKNILITGSSGFLGRLIFHHLNHTFKLFGLNKSKSYYNYDISNCVPHFNNNFFCVIHCAGLAHTNTTKKNNFHAVNVIGTINLLEALESCTRIPNQFVFISSVSVYGLIHGENINEESPLIAEDPYGKSKIDAERIVRKWCHKHNVICTILRLPLVVGIDPPGNLGRMITGIKKGYYFNVAGGNTKKSMVLASDIAKFILKAAEVGGTFNLTDGIHPTFNELSKSISQNLNKSFVPNLPLFIAKVLAKIGDIIGNSFPISSNKLSKITSTLTFDDSKAKMAFGWNPTPVLESFKIHEDV